VHAATLGKNTNGAEDVGAHGEFLTGALAPASLAGDISLGAFVSRIAADLRTGLETDADGNDDEEEEEKEEDDEEEEDDDDDFSSDRLGSDDESAAAGVSLLYRAAREDAAGIVRALLRSGVPVDGWRTSARGVTNDAQEGASSVARTKPKPKPKPKTKRRLSSRLRRSTRRAPPARKPPFWFCWSAARSQTRALGAARRLCTSPPRPRSPSRWRV
jgi:hypothetical protein